MLELNNGIIDFRDRVWTKHTSSELLSDIKHSLTPYSQGKAFETFKSRFSVSARVFEARLNEKGYFNI